eukprot:TRINITY_DN13536_c0_g1_i1.p1 TRINITY_DN13536_c0_g1~~TRINITY_DN13536_c0_g1_i1.p1  ORF type:complete len:132 (+),score=1.27 TRINITY_DN13536_c0_g1_i1:49-444(+)
MATRPWVPHARSVLCPGLPAHGTRLQMIDTCDPGRVHTTAFKRNEAVLDYWRDQGVNIGHQDESQTLKGVYSTVKKEAEAKQTRPMSKRDELKYMNQRSNLVLGYYDFAQQKDVEVKPVRPTPAYFEKKGK